MARQHLQAAAALTGRQHRGSILLLSACSGRCRADTEDIAQVRFIAQEKLCVKVEPDVLTPMLTGSDLLTKVKELGDASKSELVRECGYVSTKKDGTERLNFTAFYEALLEAKGVTLGDSGLGRGKGGRKLSYETKVQFNGNLLVGKAYTAQLGLQPGDEFEIKLGRKQIKLVPIGSADEDE
jgi:hypothetical protein